MKDETIFIIRNSKQLEEATGLISAFDNAFINRIAKVDCVSHSKIVIELEEQNNLLNLILPKSPIKVNLASTKIEYEKFIICIPKLDAYADMLFDLSM